MTAREADESLTEAATVAFREREGAQRRALSSVMDLIAEARQAPKTLDARPLKTIRDELWGDDA